MLSLGDVGLLTGDRARAGVGRRHQEAAGRRVSDRAW